MSLRSSRPIIAIVGATGTGKSQLAVDLARRFNGEVVNADALQMYKGLEVMTNKITDSECKGVPHHLLGFLDWTEQTWQVGKYVSSALGIIEKIQSQGRLPIIVGGTHYYIQKLLFKSSLVDSRLDSSDAQEELKALHEKWPILQASPEEMLERLKEVDPEMWTKWHPNDARKIQRSLEIYYKTGRKASDIYQAQSQSTGMRWPTLLLWTHSPRAILQDRLWHRVDAMLQAGLLPEARQLRQHVELEQAKGLTIDQTRGPFISIGYKEVLPYFSASDDSKTAALAKAVQQIKYANSTYAKYQDRWIRLTLLRALRDADAVDKLFIMDTSDPLQWEAKVFEPASSITQQFIDGGPLPDNRQEAERFVAYEDQSVSSKHTCDTCGVTTTTQSAWTVHIQSGRHRKRVQGERKRAAHSEWVKSESAKSSTQTT